MAECLNVEWVEANPSQSLEWARGMWFCGCDDCEPRPDVSNPTPAPLTTNETREDT